ncbi:MAG: hypothetical protein ACI9R3_000309 [Verrucomicrobiales bacterium]|jgi:hypothetical protein
MAILGQRVDRLEEAMISLAEQSKAVFAAVASIHEDVAEIRASNARTDRALLLLRQESEERWKTHEEQGTKERRDFNKRMAEISDRVGRFVEDMVHPNASRIAAKLFDGDPIRTLAIRVKRRHPSDSARVMELDLFVAGERHVLLGEAKSTPTVEKADAFLEKTAQFGEFFPEYANHTVLPMLASVGFDPSLVTYLNRRHIHALGFGDETMELLNEGAF